MDNVYHCARVHVGEYVGGGTNEDEKGISCGYETVEGKIESQRLRPLLVRGTNTEGTIFRLETFVLYPATPVAIVKITNGKNLNIRYGEIAHIPANTEHQVFNTGSINLKYIYITTKST